MRVNYYLVFIIGAIMGIYLLWKYKKGESIKDGWKHYAVAAGIGGIVLDLILLIATPTVLVIKDNKQYEKHDYFFYYVDSKDQGHGLYPSSDYIDNQSEYNVEVSAELYSEKIYRHEPGSRYSGNPIIPRSDFYSPKQFSLLYHKPTYIFKTPPSKMKIRDKSKDKEILWSLNYR